MLRSDPPKGLLHLPLPGRSPAAADFHYAFVCGNLRHYRGPARVRGFQSDAAASVRGAWIRKSRMPIYPLDIYVVTEAGQKNSTRVHYPYPKRTGTAGAHGRAPPMSARSAGGRRTLEKEVAVLMPKLIVAGYASRATIAAEDHLDFSYFFDADKPAPEPSAQATEQAEQERKPEHPPCSGTLLRQHCAQGRCSRAA